MRSLHCGVTHREVVLPHVLYHRGGEAVNSGSCTATYLPPPRRGACGGFLTWRFYSPASTSSSRNRLPITCAAFCSVCSVTEGFAGSNSRFKAARLVRM